jgi:hypothetical protein
MVGQTIAECLAPKKRGGGRGPRCSYRPSRLSRSLSDVASAVVGILAADVENSCDAVICCTQTSEVIAADIGELQARG